MIEFQTPLPPRDLSPNGRSYWRRKAEAVAMYKQSVYCDAANTGAYRHNLAPKGRLSLVFCVKGAKGKYYQPKDEDNALASFKAGIDGICAAGLLRKDDSEWMELGRVEIDCTRGPFVLVRVEPIGGEE